MIGNSHIDPVWFWNWEEGMQEVKATLCSALDRMNEFPEFRFTGTSVLFFRWLERTAPERFEELRRRVAEGRFELTGGWFLEPDCLLPHGESFVRQALYSQRYQKKPSEKSAASARTWTASAIPVRCRRSCKRAGWTAMCSCVRVWKRRCSAGAEPTAAR